MYDVRHVRGETECIIFTSICPDPEGDIPPQTVNHSRPQYETLHTIRMEVILAGGGRFLCTGKLRCTTVESGITCGTKPIMLVIAKSEL